ncbi:histone deacetylase family protein [Pararhodospirillum photometricum]|uniref:Histone deacetylase superfamily n=1 Tax=Pararhodospirillum photometricum DSM 122 TaxID=1150469 RepID=H6SJA7_PARPM|nr:histone deacetylase family protein [Pararhodospirillum photometricum]CCG08072.1 Histone deacetylase superfamily [Pararhodospirillum photometricum DSM 122]
MSTLLVSHHACIDHDPGAFHPESPQRLRAIQRALEGEDFMLLDRVEAPHVTRDQLQRVHPLSHIDAILDAVPREGHHHIDADTLISPESGEAALRAAGGVILAVDEVMRKAARNAFVAIRPPGHHAELHTAMGFCLFNNIAVGAFHARAQWGVERIAVVDWDVHHGNGTQHIFWDDPNLFFASTHEANAFPYTGKVEETGSANNIVNCPLPAGSGGDAFRAACTERLLPALEAFRPELILISAGFDAHTMDPMADLNFKVADFAWATKQIMDIAERTCESRVISVLEGGYDLTALASCVAVHVRALMEH